MKRENLKPWALWLVDHRLRLVVLAVWLVVLPLRVVLSVIAGVCEAVNEDIRPLASEVRDILEV